ncbi:MAG: TetR/AcrR family transcriptional regulator, partial [Asticcacaulis sp.]|nr:TetR/AcrR family transcriptional regulator [Asticcacaulis sp.]
MQTRSVTPATAVNANENNEDTARKGRGDRRELILDVASEVFLKEGYAAASMSEIAARLGGSKGTLYNYFKSKEELFGAYVSRNCEVHRSQVGELLKIDGDARAVLTAYARRYLEVFTSEKTLQNWRVISAESAKSPDIGRDFYESGPLRGARLLAEYLDKAVARGELKIDDTLLAAHQLISLIHGRMIKARLLNYIAVP